MPVEQTNRVRSWAIVVIVNLDASVCEKSQYKQKFIFTSKKIHLKIPSYYSTWSAWW